MSRRLPFDVERCHGHGCVFPEKCDRYNQRDNVGPRTPYQHGYNGERIQHAVEDCIRFEPEEDHCWHSLPCEFARRG